MAVRNFYVEANIDGRKTTLSGGPASKTGGMTLRLHQRNEGSITDALTVVCEEHFDYLITKVYDQNHNLVFTHETKR